MLSDQQLKAFTATTDLRQAKSFYQDILGLKLSSEDDYGIEFDANGALLRVALVQELKPQPFTILGWNVPDIQAMIRSLTEKGIEFNKYDFIPQDEHRIWTAPGGTKVPWFNDPCGNILSLSE